MREVLDAPGFDKAEEEEIKTNFQKWAFILFIVTIITMSMDKYLIEPWLNPFDDFKSHNNLSGVISLAILLSLCFGIFSTILSVVYKEEKNFRFIISAIGFFVITLLAFA